MSFIELAGVSRDYPMGDGLVRALHGIDLELPAGSFTLIVGPSGSGKSTLLHVLAAMDRPTAGRIRVGDWELSALDRGREARYRREMVGMIFQQFNLVPTMTAQANVELPLILAGVAPAERERRATEALETVGLGRRSRHRPAELSGGEQQRVAIARALVADPPLLLADEPTGNLDSDTGREIVELLGRIHREHGKTIVVVTHHPEALAHLAQHTLRLRDGVLADGA